MVLGLVGYMENSNDVHPVDVFFIVEILAMGLVSVYSAVVTLSVWTMFVRNRA